jgi:hypothetical protein
MPNPSEHFPWEELACHDGTPYPPEWVEDRLTPLLIEAEAIRAACCKELGADCPLIVTSGYRTPEYNRTLPGVMKAAPLSQHTQGRALDLKAAYLNYARFKRALLKAVRRKGSKIGYIELRPKFGYIHIDTRPASIQYIETVD